MQRERLILDRMDRMIEIPVLGEDGNPVVEPSDTKLYKLKAEDDALPKYRVVRTDNTGKAITSDTYVDEKVGRFHVLIHREFNYCVNSSLPTHTEPIGVCLRKKAADRKLYEAAHSRGMELHNRQFGFLEDLTNGGTN